MASFSDLPQPALEGIVLALLQPPQHLALSDLLTQLGRKLSDATIGVVYHRLQVSLPVVLPEDGDDALTSSAGQEDLILSTSSLCPESPSEHLERARWLTVLSNPNRYASAIRSLVVCPPARPDQIRGLETIPVDQGEAEVVLRLLRACDRLETLEWRGIAGWGDEIGLALLSIPTLKYLSLLPPPLHASSTTTQNADLPRVSLLHALPTGLRTLAVSHLSTVGHKNFHLHLSTLPAYAPLDKLAVEDAMLDDHMCEVIGEAGRGIKDVWLRTSGTKLTDRGIASILEGCLELESLTLSEVEGRLPKTLWARLEGIPDSFKLLRIEIADVGPHHSWITDHLDSLSALPLAKFEALAVTRNTPPFALFPIAPQGHTVPSIDDLCEIEPIPPKLFNNIIDQGVALTVLEIDWWECSTAELTSIAKTLVHLVKLKVALDAPFTKLLTLTTPFSHLVNLQTLHVIIPSRHIPLPSANVLNPAPLHTPSSSPVSTKLAAFASPVVHTTALPTPPTSTSDLPTQIDDIHPLLFEKSQDPTLPPLKDVKKFVRRVPRLRELGWVGRAGVGFWIATRDTSDGADAPRTTGSGGRKSSGTSLGAAAKSLTDLEFVSLAVLWKDEWKEAGRGPPRWLFKGSQEEGVVGRARSHTGQSLSRSLASVSSLDERSFGGRASRDRKGSSGAALVDESVEIVDEPSQFQMDDVPSPPSPTAAPRSTSPKKRKSMRKSSASSAGRVDTYGRGGSTASPQTSPRATASAVLISPTAPLSSRDPALGSSVAQSTSPSSAATETSVWAANRSTFPGSPTYSATAAGAAKVENGWKRG